MPTLSVNTDAESASEDQTLLTLYDLAGEESGGFITFRPHFIHELSKSFFSAGPVPSPAYLPGDVVVRELTPVEMVRAERELWIHYHQQKADRERDRLFAVFTGTKIIGVARCARHTDGLEVDCVYVLDEFRLRGFARSVMKLLIEECGRQETLYMHSKTELVDFYGSLGFHPIREAQLPKTIRERFDFCLGELKGIDVCPMKRDPGYIAPEESTLR
jgi:N-acetylglutamate synthase-like GNAT family acetyltransferase